MYFPPDPSASAKQNKRFSRNRIRTPRTARVRDSSNWNVEPVELALSGIHLDKLQKHLPRQKYRWPLKRSRSKALFHVRKDAVGPEGAYYAFFLAVEVARSRYRPSNARPRRALPCSR